MIVQCLTCSRFDIRNAGGMARLGYGLCILRPKCEFYGIDTERECDRHSAARQEIVDGRRAWLAKLEAKGRT